MGERRDVLLPQDYYTKRPRGFAFVEFVDQRDAEDAKAELDGSTLDGRWVIFRGWDDTKRSNSWSRHSSHSEGFR